MKLKKVSIKNFRCFKDEIEVMFNDITTFIGKNDIGKSTVLEALEIFFNNSIVKIDKDDPNVHSENKEVVITCDFCDLPETVILDADAHTTLKEEFLTIEEDTLRIKKVFDCSKTKPSVETYIIANHPTSDVACDILSYKEKELQKVVKDRGLDVNLKGNPTMRHAIWDSFEDLKIATTEINISKVKEDLKRIWENLDKYLPVYALFQCDRSSTDGDSEVQNPMKHAVSLALQEAEAEIKAIQEKVQTRAMEIACNTHGVLKTLDPSLASQITPQFENPSQTKWNGLFSVKMNTDDDIPLNKRGSGVRRLILVSFFKAEADRKAIDSTKKDVIYAIEEPETSMHPDYQMLLINSFLELSKLEHCQVILTTHSPNFANELPTGSLRFVSRELNGNPIIKSGDDIIPEIVKALGILPKAESLQKVKVILCLEGPTDIPAFKCFNRCLHSKYNDIVDIESDERVAIMPLGGSALKYWVSQNYLQKLKCKEVHIYDRDVLDYQEAVKKVNARGDGSWGALTQKYEIENYLHPEAIKNVYDVEIDTTQDDVPKLFGIAYSRKKQLDGEMKGNKAKTYLSKVFNEAMTMDYLSQLGAEEEIKGWFDNITKLLQ